MLYHRFATAFFALPALALTPALAAASSLPSGIVASAPRAVFADLGPAPASSELRLAFTLTYRDRAQLDELVEAQSDESSPLYRHFLSSEQFDAAFAPTPADYARTIAELRRAGFHVVQTYSNRTVLDAVASVGSIDSFFKTDIHRVVQPGFGIRYANVLPARISPALNGRVLSVDGLNTLTLVHSHHVRARKTLSGPDIAGPPLKGPVNPEYNAAGYGPLAFSQGYDLPEQHSIPNQSGNSYTGTGRFSGVVIDADFLDTDLAAFLNYFNVTRTGPATVRVPIDGGPPSGLGSPDSVETTLDVQTIVSNAPGTSLYVYEFPSFNSDQYITDAYDRVVSDNIVDTANSSFGGCDYEQGSAARAWDAVAEQGAALGITFHASTGDGGSDGGCTEAPSSGPHFVAVGGTTLSVDSNGNWRSESGWSGSGGGVSTVFSLPAWQKNVANVIASGRNTPDVAFDANPDTGAAFYYGGTWENQDDPLGGTSLASPIYGAAQTEIDEVAGGRYGLAGQKIFKTFKKGGSLSGIPSYHDIKVGSNGEYQAKVGYDQVTGIGSLNVWDFFR